MVCFCFVGGVDIQGEWMVLVVDIVSGLVESFIFQDWQDWVENFFFQKFGIGGQVEYYGGWNFVFCFGFCCIMFGLKYGCVCCVGFFDYVMQVLIMLV